MTAADSAGPAGPAPAAGLRPPAAPHAPRAAPATLWAPAVGPTSSRRRQKRL